jgi:hypothetical protein
MSAYAIGIITVTSLNDDIRAYLEQIDATLQPYAGRPVVRTSAWAREPTLPVPLPVGWAPEPTRRSTSATRASAPTPPTE